MILFDHTGDGFKTPTGWALPDDPWLEYDADGSGIIDSGAELFGAYTILPDGCSAPQGFTALNRYDINGEGENT